MESRKWTARRVQLQLPICGLRRRARGLPVYETPVGFKYIGELINENKIVIGGEESRTIDQSHYPEKDGILACLLAAEAAERCGASLTEQLKELYGRVGKLESGRIGIRLTPELMQSLGDKLKGDPREIGGRRVERTNRMDGLSLFCGRFMAVDAAFRDRTSCSHLRRIRISNGLEVLLEQGHKFYWVDERIRAQRVAPRASSTFASVREISLDIIGLPKFAGVVELSCVGDSRMVILGTLQTVSQSR